MDKYLVKIYGPNNTGLIDVYIEEANSAEELEKRYTVDIPTFIPDSGGRPYAFWKAVVQKI